MARIFPFRALRYNTMDVAIADVVTQPYDKITPAMQQAYYSRSPYNLVRLTLGLPELFDEPGRNDVYTRAARDFVDWRQQGILYQENEPCIYAYLQRYKAPGSSETKERRGFIALGELQDYSAGVVFRHEQTLAKPKADRKNLLDATRAQYGPIFMLYSDPALPVERTIFGSRFRAEIELTDEFGTEHQLARISEPNLINIIAGAMADKKLIIADGHHRYETALAYSREHAPATPRWQERNLSNSLPAPPYPEAATVMMFVNMDAEGLTILPTHRVVHGLKHFDAADLLKRADTFFTITPLTGTNTEEHLHTLATAGVEGPAFIAVFASGRYLLQAKPEPIAQALSTVSHRQRQLDVVILHSLLIEKLLGLSAEAIREETHLRYVRDANEAVQQVAETGHENGSSQVTGESADAAFLLNACSLEQLREIAFGGETMPQKSTDFYPKLLSGLAIYGMD
jgi:uncharacterized protein (DUF1015 family)